MKPKQALKVLNVDDNKEMVDHIDRVFKEESFINKIPLEMTSTHLATKAVDSIKREKFDIAIVNYMMPEYDGLEITKILKTKNPKTFVALTSVRGDQDFIEKVLKKGCDYFVSLPIEAREIFRIVKKLFSEE